MPHQNGDDNGLSAEEFKNKMYVHLKKKGHIDALKTQLRYKIVEELRGASVIKFPTESMAEDETAFKLANSLVADYLRRNQYDYSLSVFLPESGSNHDQLYSAREVLHMLHIPAETDLYKRLLESTSNRPKKAFLQTFLSEVSRTSDELLRTRIQTTKTDSQESLGDKLLRLDQLHSTKRESLEQSNYLASEERIMLYQRQLEERSRADVKAQVDRFRDNELATIRIEERDKCRKELADARMEMERLYQAKMEALKEREKNASERVQRLQEGQEKEIFTQRQSVLGEIELLRHRESQVRREMDANERDLKLREERLKEAENETRRRELGVRQTENEFEIKLKEEMNKFRLEEELRFTQRVKQVEQAELANNEDRKIIDAEKHTLYELRTELHEKQMKLNELETTLELTNLDLASVRRENQMLTAAGQTIDYKYVKEENSLLKRELEVLKTRHCEMQNELESEKTATERLQKHMADAGCAPSIGEMFKQRSGKDSQSRTTNEDRRRLEERLAQEIDTNREMMSHFEQHTNQYKEMNKEISQLRHQLLSTQRSLKKGILPSYSLGESRSGSESDISTTEDYFDTPLAKTNPEPELQLMQGQYASFKKPQSGRGSRSRGPRLDSSLDSGDEIVVDAWKRLKQLEAETENLETSYKSFQARMSSLHSAVIPNETIRTTAAKYRVVFADTISESIGATRDGSSGTGYTAGQYERAAPGGQRQQHSRVAFDRSSKASPPISQTLAPKGKTPLSSTPYRPRKSKASHEDSAADLKGLQSTLDPLPSLELSTVTSGTTSSDQRPPLPKDVNEQERRSRQLNVDDLDAGSQSPSVVVVSGSQTTLSSSSLEQADPNGTQNTSRGQNSTLKSHEPSGITIDDTPLELCPDDLATPSPSAVPAHLQRPDDTPSFTSPPVPTRLPILERPAAVSLDDAWKTTHVETAMRPLTRPPSTEELRKQQEEEDRKFEEQRLKREEWRKKRDEEVYEQEREQSETAAKKNVATEEPEPATADDAPDIDPVMQKYMDMIQAQETAHEQTPTTPNAPAAVKGRTPVHSDNEISLGGVDEEKKTKSNDESDSFEW